MGQRPEISEIEQGRILVEHDGHEILSGKMKSSSLDLEDGEISDSESELAYCRVEFQHLETENSLLKGNLKSLTKALEENRRCREQENIQKMTENEELKKSIVTMK